MPILTVEESAYAGPIDENEVLTAEVTSVKETSFKDAEGKEVLRFEFTFVVDDDTSPYHNTRIWGTTSRIFNSHPDCKLRNWSQAIMGAELPIGTKLDTDDLVNSKCRVVVGQKTYMKDGEEKVRNFVADVLPATGFSITAADEQPF